VLLSGEEFVAVLAEPAGEVREQSGQARAEFRQAVGDLGWVGGRDLSSGGMR
jgi:hypothetical protein